MTAADVAAVVGARPDAIMLPKAEGAPSIAQLDTILRSEAKDGASLPAILPIATETPGDLHPRQLSRIEGPPCRPELGRRGPSRAVRHRGVPRTLPAPYPAHPSSD